VEESFQMAIPTAVRSTNANMPIWLSLDLRGAAHLADFLALDI
jgi:hypothetical protein